MGWFLRFCRQSGLIIHQVLKPVNAPRNRGRSREVRKDTEQEKVSPDVTLRRTTIEEIEVRNNKTDGP